MINAYTAGTAMLTTRFLAAMKNRGGAKGRPTPRPSRVGLRRLWSRRIHADLSMVPGRCRGHSPIIRTLLPHSRVMSSTSDVRMAIGPG